MSHFSCNIRSLMVEKMKSVKERICVSQFSFGLGFERIFKLQTSGSQLLFWGPQVLYIINKMQTLKKEIKIKHLFLMFNCLLRLINMIQLSGGGISRPPCKWCKFGKVFNGQLGHLYKGDWKTAESYQLMLQRKLHLLE